MPKAKRAGPASISQQSKATDRTGPTAVTTFGEQRTNSTTVTTEALDQQNLVDDGAILPISKIRWLSLRFQRRRRRRRRRIVGNALRMLIPFRRQTQLHVKGKSQNGPSPPVMQTLVPDKVTLSTSSLKMLKAGYMGTEMLVGAWVRVLARAHKQHVRRISSAMNSKQDSYCSLHLIPRGRSFYFFITR